VLVKRLVLLVEKEVVAGGLHRLEAGLEKTRVKKNKNKTARFFFGLLGFFGFLVFLGFLNIYSPRRESFRVFSVSRTLLGASRL
jgi:hypothetical protein